MQKISSHRQVGNICKYGKSSLPSPRQKSKASAKTNQTISRLFFSFKPGFLNRDSRPPLGTTKRFSGEHEQRPLLTSSVVILQNPM